MHLLSVNRAHCSLLDLQRKYYNNVRVSIKGKFVLSNIALTFRDSRMQADDTSNEHSQLSLHARIVRLE